MRGVSILSAPATPAARCARSASHNDEYPFPPRCCDPDQHLMCLRPGHVVDMGYKGMAFPAEVVTFPQCSPATGCTVHVRYNWLGKNHVVERPLTAVRPYGTLTYVVNRPPGDRQVVKVMHRHRGWERTLIVNSETTADGDTLVRTRTGWGTAAVRTLLSTCALMPPPLPGNETDPLTCGMPVPRDVGPSSVVHSADTQYRLRLKPGACVHERVVAARMLGRGQVRLFYLTFSMDVSDAGNVAAVRSYPEAVLLQQWTLVAGANPCLVCVQPGAVLFWRGDSTAATPAVFPCPGQLPVAVTVLHVVPAIVAIVEMGSTPGTCFANSGTSFMVCQVPERIKHGCCNDHDDNNNDNNDGEKWTWDSTPLTVAAGRALTFDSRFTAVNAHCVSRRVVLGPCDDKQHDISVSDGVAREYWPAHGGHVVGSTSSGPIIATCDAMYIPRVYLEMRLAWMAAVVHFAHAAAT